MENSNKNNDTVIEIDEGINNDQLELNENESYTEEYEHVEFDEEDYLPQEKDPNAVYVDEDRIRNCFPNEDVQIYYKNGIQCMKRGQRRYKVKEGNVVLPDGVELNMNRDNYVYMQLLQGYVMEILLVVDKFCREHNLTYYLGEGTLLGALRHKGFIPWDDDADILMPREDYERFLELAKDGLPEGYQLDSPETNPHHWTILSQVQLTRKVPYTKKRLEGIALNNGPSLDIFPMDYVPDCRSEELKWRGNKIRILRRVLWIKSGLHKRSWYKTIKRKLLYYYPLKTYGLFRSFKALHDDVTRIMTETNDKNNGYLCVFSSLYYARRETFHKEFFGEPQYVEFEGHMLPIPAMPEKILNRVYGEYMLLPSVNGRKSKHHFKLDSDAMVNLENDEVFNNIKLKYDDIETKLEFKRIKSNDNSNEKSKHGIGLGLFSRIFKFKKSKKRKITFKQLIRTHKKQLKKSAVRRRIDKRCALISKYYKLPIKDKTVFYDSFSGLGILDSPRTLFKAMLAREEFKDFVHIWTVNNESVSKLNLDEFKDLPNVKFVKRNSKEYLEGLTTSKYVVCNSSVPQYFARRPEQLYLNTWHGVPSKVMGYERPGQRVNATQNIVHNFLNTTHMVAANHFTGERMFQKAYMMEGIYNGIMLDEPLPRTDTLRNTSREYAMERLRAAGITTDKKIVVYAPTWKGQLYNSLDYDLTELKEAVATLRNNINTDEYEVFLRVHYFIYRAILMDEEMSKICIPFTVDTSELLSVVDILISDYSSIFFDFLGTGRPILFYVPDLNEYSENRGLYIPMEDMPGPVSQDLEEIAGYINNIEQVKKDYKAKYDAMYEWCCSKEDGGVADRIIDAVILGKENAAMDFKTDKTKLLFMADWTKPFIHQVKFTKLLKKIDYDKYDVTVLTGKPKRKEQNKFLENLDPRVRILINDKRINATWSQKHKAFQGLRDRTISLEKAAEPFVNGNEWQRLVGDCEFDELVMIRSKSTPLNWLILSYIAPIAKKTLIATETVRESVYELPDMHRHFNSISDNLGVLKRFKKKV